MVTHVNFHAPKQLTQQHALISKQQAVLALKRSKRPVNPP
jgi:hypothetical protein